PEPRDGVCAPGPGVLPTGEEVRKYSLTLILAALAAAPALAHPVPRRSHDRAIEVRPTPDGLVVRYRLEMDEWTAVFVDVPNLLPADEVRKYTKPTEFYAALTKAVAPLVADKLFAWLDDQPLTF